MSAFWQKENAKITIQKKKGIGCWFLHFIFHQIPLMFVIVIITVKFLTLLSITRIFSPYTITLLFISSSLRNNLSKWKWLACYSKIGRKTKLELRSRSPSMKAVGWAHHKRGTSLCYLEEKSRCWGLAHGCGGRGEAIETARGPPKHYTL